MTHSDLVMSAYEWVIKRGGCGVAFREFKTYASNSEMPDVIGFCSGGSTLVECKVSRKDFLRDAKKLFRVQPGLGMGKYRYYCAPTGLLQVEELPENWGLLEVSGDGRAKRVYNPYGMLNGNIYNKGFERNVKAENELMYSALRRLHIRGRIEEVYEARYEAKQKIILPPMPTSENDGPF